MRCRICDSEQGNREFTARELMFGTRDPFAYQECAQCGCLQIVDPPSDMGRYYPPDYYSFRPVPPEQAIKRYLKHKRGAYALTGRGLLGKWLVRRYGTPVEAQWAKRVNLRLDAAVLDVGCGAGQNLVNLATLGFRHLRGIDPYLPQDYQYPNGVVIARRQLAAEGGRYDFVMLHHSFEHMADPIAVFGHLQRLLAPGGFVLIRMPVAQTHAWRTYGVHWVQLDAPRHLIVYSVQGVRMLADRCGFALEDVVYDSTGFQFWGSEQYRRGIPLLAEQSVARGHGPFTAAELRAFEEQAAALNVRQDGDQACFYLRKLP